MKLFGSLPIDLLSLLFLTLSLPARTRGENILQTTGFDNCGVSGASISVSELILTFDEADSLVNFDVAITSTLVQNVTASLEVYAYGKLVYSKDLDPCDSSNFIQQLCPGESRNSNVVYLM